MYKISKAKFGEYIKKVRKERGISREELANRLYVSVGAVCKWENGKRYPDFEILGNLANELGISTQDIFDNSKEESNASSVVRIISLVLLFGVLAMGIVLGVLNISKRMEKVQSASPDDSEAYIIGRALRIENSGSMAYPVNHIHDTKLLVDIEGEGPTYVNINADGAMDVHTGDKVRLIAVDGMEIRYLLTYPAQIQNVRIEVIEKGSRKDAQATIDKLVKEGLIVDVTCACVDDDKLVFKEGVGEEVNEK